MIIPGVVAPRYMGPDMLPRHASPGTTMPYRNRHQTYALLQNQLPPAADGFEML